MSVKVELPTNTLHWRRAILTVGVVSALVSGAYFGAAIAQWTGLHTLQGVMSWVSEFMKSPGFAGLCAIAAASFAYVGISNQVRAARAATAVAQSNAASALAAQQKADAGRAWWNTFEWATSRAIPADVALEPLPYKAVISTFNALLTSATDSMQESAIAGVISHAAERESARRANGPTEASANGSTEASANGSTEASANGSTEASAEDSAQLREVLANYNSSAAGTQARVPQIEDQLYGLNVVEAFRRLEKEGDLEVLPIFVMSRGRETSSPDALVKVNGKTIRVEIFPRPVSPEHLDRIPRGAERLRRDGVSEPILIVAPSSFRDIQRELMNADARGARWESSDDDRVLLDALRRLAEIEH